jgi:hypothetical protein
MGCKPAEALRVSGSDVEKVAIESRRLTRRSSASIVVRSKSRGLTKANILWIKNSTKITKNFFSTSAGTVHYTTPVARFTDLFGA